MNPKTKAAQILIVDEFDEDLNMVKNVFDSSKTVNELIVFNDHDKGFNYIKTIDGKFSNPPDIIIIDVQSKSNVYRFEIIKEIKFNSDLKHIPIIVFSRSSDPKLIKKCYGLHVSSYIIKSADDLAIKKAVEKLEAFWFSTAKLSFLQN